MISINEKELTVEIKETLSFEHSVQPMFEDIYDDIKGVFEDDKDNLDDDTIKSYQEFLNYKMTNEDKVDILKRIVDDYEFELYRGDCEVSIFDEDGIRKAICDWINDNFDVEW